MDVLVHLGRGKSGQRRSARPSLLGDGLLERLRSTSLALLGLTTAIGLGLVAVALQQDWPAAPNLPIPGISSEESGAIADREAVPEPAERSPSDDRAVRSRPPRPSRTAALQPAPAGSQLASAHRVSSPAPSPTDPAGRPPGDDEPDSAPANPQPAQDAVPVTNPAPNPASTPGTTPPPVTASVGTPPAEEDRGRGRWRSAGRSWTDEDRGSRWRDSGSKWRDEDRWSDDEDEDEDKVPAPSQPIDDDSDSPPPSGGDWYDEDDSDDDDHSSDWDDRGHGRGHRR